MNSEKRHLHLNIQITHGQAADVSVHLRGSLLQVLNFILTQMCLRFMCTGWNVLELALWKAHALLECASIQPAQKGN